MLKLPVICLDIQAATPAAVIQNDIADDDDDEPLNEDDDDELDDVEQGEDLNTAHLVLAQFDKVFVLYFSSNVCCTLLPPSNEVFLIYDLP